MSTYSYEEHLKQQEARRTSSGNSQGPEVHFMGEFLVNDGDVAITRFPYVSMADIKYTSTHLIMNYPGRKYGARVRCEGVNCPMCGDDIKVDERVFLKALVYVIDEASGTVQAKNVVWDRASAFADIDIKGLIDEYGSLKDKLFKVKKNGTGQGTRYTIMPILNTAVYKPEIYVADFTELDQVEPEKILSKSYAQYQAVLNPNATADKTNSVPARTASAANAPVYTAPAAPAPVTQTASVANDVPPFDPAPQPTVSTTPINKVEAPAANTEIKRNRYQF